MQSFQNLNLEFYLNNQLIKTSATPETTALDLIREKLGLTGAKKVCAEGDCGACTIALGRLWQEKFTYQAINSCILPAARLHGSHVITIEGLAESNKLHLIQQMMLDKHAVQCGYCTAGMVMSLFCLLVNNRKPTEEEIFSALEGNLCRCTGYRAIHSAALSLAKIAEQSKTQEFLPDYAKTIPALLKNIVPLTLTTKTGAQEVITCQDYRLPKTLPELFTLMKKSGDNFKILNGGSYFGSFLYNFRSNFFAA